MRSFEGKVAVITGAGGGMGLAIANALVAHGCNVAVCDVREDVLAGAKATIQASASKGAKVTVHRVDVTCPDDIEQFQQEVAAAHGAKVHLLINNAGMSVNGTLLSIPKAVFDKVLAVSVTGTVDCTRAFLPMLDAAEEGYIVNFSSVVAWWGSLGHARGPMQRPPHEPYTAAKAAVMGFSHALMMDCRQNYPHINVACVHPGAVATNIVELAQLRRDPAILLADCIRRGIKGAEEMTHEERSKAMGNKFKENAPIKPEQAATVILNGLKANSTRILIGEDAHVLDILSRLFPRLIYNDTFMSLVLGPWCASSMKIGSVLGFPVGRLAYPSIVAALAFGVGRLASAGARAVMSNMEK